MARVDIHTSCLRDARCPVGLHHYTTSGIQPVSKARLSEAPSVVCTSLRTAYTSYKFWIDRTGFNFSEIWQGPRHQWDTSRCASRINRTCSGPITDFAAGARIGSYVNHIRLEHDARHVCRIHGSTCPRVEVRRFRRYVCVQQFMMLTSPVHTSLQIVCGFSLMVLAVPLLMRSADAWLPVYPETCLQDCPTELHFEPE